MKYLDEYRDGAAARSYAQQIARITTRPWSLMEVCGGQTHAIVKFGIDELLPKQITLIHGPGCPVCVTPLELIDKALEIDSYPDRQDLNVALLKMARQTGARISLGTDAHHPWQLQFIEFGLAAARKARISPDRIINFLPLLALRDWVAQARSRSAGA